jgi:DMSO/TMAO reductase YedYZ molybdopterin-dependent catalytic subunit
VIPLGGAACHQMLCTATFLCVAVVVHHQFRSGRCREHVLDERSDPVVNQEMSRRTLLKGGGAAIAGLSAFHVAGPAHAFPGGPDDEVIPWLDQPPEPPFPDTRFLKWEELDSYFTPPEKFFIVSHYGNVDVDATAWRLDIDGLVAQTQSLSLADLMARPRREVTFTLECSGNHGFPFVIGAIGNARWAGTPLAPLLERAGLARDASEVVF